MTDSAADVPALGCTPAPMKRAVVFVVITALAVLAATSATPLAQAAGTPPRRPPTELWKAFPLKDKPEPVVRYGTAGTSISRLYQPPVAAEADGGADPYARLSTLLLATAMGLTLTAVALVLFGSPFGSPVVASTGSAGRSAESRRRRNLLHSGVAALALRPRRRQGTGTKRTLSRQEFTAPPPGHGVGLDAQRAPAAAFADEDAATKYVEDGESEVELLKAKGEARLPAGLRAKEIETLKAKQAGDAVIDAYAVAEPETLKAKLAAADAALAPEAKPAPVAPADEVFEWTDSRPEEVEATEAGPELERELLEAVARPRLEVSAVAACRVRWVRGYRTSEFELWTPADEKMIASSPSFRWHKRTPPPESREATGALAALVEAAELNGWTPSGERGREWYELEFTLAHVPRAGRPAASCAIEWSRAYVTARFSAIAYDAELHPTTVAHSPAFRWLKNEPPHETADARTALRMLVRLLQEEGWQVSGRGPVWFALQFTQAARRPTPVPAGRRPRRTKE